MKTWLLEIPGAICFCIYLRKFKNSIDKTQEECYPNIKICA